MIGVVSDIIRILIGAILIVSASLHLANPYLFYESFLAYQIVPREWAVFVAAFLIQFCLFAGVAVAFNRLTPEIHLLTGILFLIFLIAQVTSLIRGLTIDCGCFGAMSGEVDWKSTGLAGALMLAAIFIYFQESKNAESKEVSLH